MEKYRKGDQHYEDKYDRSTIEILKKIEKEKDDLIKYPLTKIGDKTLDYSMTHRMKYQDAGALYAQNKKDTIAKWKWDDEEKDRIIEKNSPPLIRNCQECNVRLHFRDFMFLRDNYEVIMIYDCPKKKEHKKFYFNTGVEYIPKKRLCEKCGGQLISKTKKTKFKLILSDTCTGCGKIIKDEFNITPEKPINEAERKKYCIDFKNSSTFSQDLEKIVHLKQLIIDTPEKNKNDQYDIEKIEKLTVSKLETRLKTAMKKHGFLKFQFEKTKIDRFVLTEFSVQDNMDRDEENSIKALKKFLQSELLMTNWRLMNSDIHYKLGFLTGKLKGFEEIEDLLKLAKEIKEKSIKPKRT